MTSFDKPFFDRWYHNPRKRVHTPGDVRRHAALALSVAEYFLERRVQRVLDVGCGVGSWRTAFRALRPGIQYAGVDPSEYVVQRFGAQRRITLGGFGTLSDVDGIERFDLVVCVDALHYMPRKDIVRGAATLGKRLNGVALLHAFTKSDDIEGDVGGLMSRRARFYRDIFTGARLTDIGLGFWVARTLKDRVAALEAAPR